MTDEEPVHDSFLSLPLLDHIDSICTDFETAWQAVAPPSLEQYVGQARGVERPELLRELLRLELDYRNRRTRELSLETLQRQFPDDVQVIANVFRECIAPPESGAGPPDQPAVHGDATTANLDQTGTWGEEGDADDTTCRLVGDTSTVGQRFRIKRSHAKGGLGEVFVARDQELHRDVALKEIQQQHADDAAGRSRFSLEAEVTARLEHPGIVPVYGLGTHSDGRPFYAMRLIHGESLQQAIEQFYAGEGERSVSERMIAFRQLLGRFVDVCQTIAYAHSRGVLHRDVKPSNIMLGKYGETLVVDWGLAKVTCSADGQASSSAEEPPLIPQLSAGASPDTAMGATLGTPAYMSPEQAIGQVEELGVACDVYSLGATLYTILTGRTPFGGARAADILRQVQAGEFTAPRTHRPTLSRALEAVCLKAMALEPHDRYASARALADDMEAWLADEPVSAYPEPAAQQLGRWVRRHRGLVLATSAAVVVAVIGLGVGNLLLAGKNRELEAANIQVTDAMGHADNRFDLAMQAIEDYYTGVSKDVLLREPGFEELRRRLLELPLHFYERLLIDLKDEQDPDSLVNLGDAYAAIARIKEQVASAAEAIQASQHAVKIFEQLVNAYPQPVVYRDRLVNCLMDLANVRFILQEQELAVAINLRAMDIATQLAAEHPQDPKFLTQLAMLHNNIGNHYQSMGKQDAARESYQNAVRIQESLAAAHPAIAEYRVNLARHFFNIGNNWSGEGRTHEALEYYRKAISIQEDLVAQYPLYRLYLLELAQGHVVIATPLRLLGRRDEAVDHYQAALKLSQKLTEAFPNVAAYRYQLGQAQINLGILSRELGQVEEGHNYARAALTIYESLAAQFPDVPRYQFGLAMSYGVLADYCGDEGASEESIQYHRQAVGVLEKLVAAHPDVVKYQKELASECYNLARPLRGCDEPDESLLFYGRAIQMDEALAAKYPENPNYQLRLLKCYTSLGYFQRTLDRNEEALASYARAIRLGEPLVVKYPEVSDYAVNLGGAYCNRGITVKASDVEASVGWYTKAISLLESALQHDENHRAGRQFLVNSHNSRALALKELGRYDAAISDWNRMIELLPPNKEPTLRLMIARTRTMAGDHASAAREAEAVFAATESVGSVAYDAARVLAMAADAAARDATIPEDKHAAQVVDYAERAMKLLQKARDLGSFDQEAAVQDLRRNTDLAAIRSRSDFQALLDGLTPRPEQ